MFFNSNNEINRLRKEKNASLSKGISNIYLKVTIKKMWRAQGAPTQAVIIADIMLFVKQKYKVP